MKRDRSEDKNSLRPIAETLDSSEYSTPGDDPDAPTYRCSICYDYGWVYPRKEDDTIDYSKSVPCVCRRSAYKRRRINDLLAQCELPEGTASFTFEKFMVGNNQSLLCAKGFAEQVAHGSLAWLGLIGGVNRGKTHLAIAACREGLKRDKPALYYHVPLLLDHLRAGFEAGDFDHRFRFFCEVPLLALDDLGVENPTPWVMERLDTIIDYRYVRQLPLIITTNLDARQLRERIRSRIERIESGEVVTIDAPEYRGKRHG